MINNNKHSQFTSSVNMYIMQRPIQCIFLFMFHVQVLFIINRLYTIHITLSCILFRSIVLKCKKVYQYHKTTCLPTQNKFSKLKTVCTIRTMC